MNKNNKAFTLVELVITILVLIVLSSIATPIYIGHVNRAKYAEGYALIGNIMKAEDLYRGEYGNFYYLSPTWAAGGTIYTSKSDVLGVNASGNKYFTKFTLQCDTSGKNAVKGEGWFVQISLFHRIGAYGKASDKKLIMLYDLTGTQTMYEA